jgi:hypothetical protein
MYACEALLRKGSYDCLVVLEDELLNSDGLDDSSEAEEESEPSSILNNTIA